MRASLPWLLLVAAATFLAACGGTESGPDDDASSPRADTSADNSAGEVTHVSGTVQVRDDVFVLQPTGGGEPIEFAYGPEVAPAEVRALEAAGTTAKVNYRPSDDTLVAASVDPAPTVSPKLQSYKGNVVSIDQRRLVVEGAKGTRTFLIAAADAGAFDVEHLREHQGHGEPIVVYFDAVAPEVGIAYEDA